MYLSVDFTYNLKTKKISNFLISSLNIFRWYNNLLTLFLMKNLAFFWKTSLKLHLITLVSSYKLVYLFYEIFLLLEIFRYFESYFSCKAKKFIFHSKNFRFRNFCIQNLYKVSCWILLDFFSRGTFISR